MLEKVLKSVFINVKVIIQGSKSQDILSSKVNKKYILD